LTETKFHFTGQTKEYHGKVRDVYTIDDRYIVMIASDRISAFDVILSRPIPYKGTILNQTAAKFLRATADICPNWLIDVPAPNASVGYLCEPIRVEMVIRGYLTGHAWRTYKTGDRIICGVTMPDAMKEHDKFAEPIITPASKAEAGHDEDISREDIIARGVVSEAVYLQMEEYTRALYARGSEMAREKGLILVDTKYEFGMYNGKLMLMDEVHTPDSSRYFYKEGYEIRQALSQPQRQLSKEFVREWLIDHNFQGKQGQSVPNMSDAWVQTISNRYIELYEQITGERFDPSSLRMSEAEMVTKIEEALEPLK